MQRQYENVIIVTPLLTEDQVKELTASYKKFIQDKGGEIVNEENWGLRKLAYQIDKKSTGFYNLFEFNAEPDLVEKLEKEYKRDERILRFLTVKLDKDGQEYNEKRRRGEVGKKPGQASKQQTESANS